MSNADVQIEVERIYKDLRAAHSAGFIRNVIRGLERKLNRDERQNEHDPKTDRVEES